MVRVAQQAVTDLPALRAALADPHGAAALVLDGPDFEVAEAIDLARPVALHGAEGGTVLRLRKLHADYDPRDRVAAMAHVHRLQAAGEIATGLLYVEGDALDLHAALNTSQTPLNALDERALCPGSAMLHKINAALR